MSKYIEKECEGRCPNCDSENISYGDSELNDSSYTYEATCDDCGTEFTEEYNLHYTVSVIRE
jgi:transcription elongation factor Elf1